MSHHPIESILLLIVSYHVGINDYRVGAGPRRILANGLVDRLQTLGYAVSVEEIPPVDTFEGEIGRSIELIRRVSLAVTSAIKAHSFPIVLAGNCNTSVGVAAGLNQSNSFGDFDLVWFDAHSDLDSPDEHVSGYFDGMGVSMLTGESWKGMVETVPGWRPVPLEKVVFCGVRDVSEKQREKLERLDARVVYGGTTSKEPIDFAGRLRDVLDGESGRSCLVHVDLDCLDSSIGKANEFAAPGGLSESDLLRCFEVVSRERRPAALTVASFNPGLEGGDRIADVAVDAISRLMLLMKSDEWYST